MGDTSRRSVFETIRDLHNQDQIVTRDTLATVMNVKRQIIDSHVRVLIDDGCVVRVKSGVYRPAITHAPARQVSKTVLSGGCVRVLIGNDIGDTSKQKIDLDIVLTPQEARTLGSMMMGDALQHSNIEAGHYASQIATMFGVYNKNLRDNNKAFEE